MWIVLSIHILRPRFTRETESKQIPFHAIVVQARRAVEARGLIIEKLKLMDCTGQQPKKAGW
jgi:hypothetical protein